MHRTTLIFWISIFRKTNTMTSIKCPCFHPEYALGKLSRIRILIVKSTNLFLRKPHMKELGEKKNWGTFC